MTDGIGNFIQVSPSVANILGYRPEEMVGRSAVDFIHPDDLESTRQEMRAARRGLQVRSFEARYPHRDGQHIVTLNWMGSWSEPVRRHFFIGRDLTEKRAAEAQLRQAQKMDAIGQLTGGVAHDFNNILTVITGTIGILAEAVADRPELVSIAKLIDDAAERGAQLTKHLLAFARKQPLQPVEIDVNSLIARGRQIAASDARRADRDFAEACGRSLAGAGRSQPAHHRDPQSRPERARRDAARRQADARDRATSISTRTMRA